MKFDGEIVAKDFEEAFGFPLSNLTAKQIWWIVKVAKHARKYCRNNSAFNNWANRSFPNVQFREVTKQNARGNYQGLQISKSSDDVYSGEELED